MKLKVVIIDSIVNVLATIKLSKITDKEVKEKLIKDYLLMRQVVKRAQEDRQEIIDKFRSDWGDTINEVEKLRKEKKPVDEYKDFLTAEEDTVSLITKLFNVEEELSLSPVKLDDFISAVGEENITLETIAFLEDCGILE